MHVGYRGLIFAHGRYCLSKYSLSTSATAQSLHYVVTEPDVSHFEFQKPHCEFFKFFIGQIEHR